MGKRFTETEKWKKNWFLSLVPAHKCFWFYLLDNCSAAGIWDVNFRLATFLIGEELNETEIRAVFRDQFREFDGGKRWEIPDFIRFQYGVLSEACKPHSRVIEELKRYGLFKGTTYPLERVEEQEEEKEEDKDKEKEEEKKKFNKSVAFEVVWKDYPNKAGKTKAFQKFCSTVKTEDNLQAIGEALRRYLKHLRVNTWKQAQDGKTWFGSWLDWVDFEEQARGTDAPALTKQQRENIRQLEELDGKSRVAEGDFGSDGSVSGTGVQRKALPRGVA